MTAQDQAAIDNFAVMARRFCSWAEDSIGSDSFSEMQFARSILAELHLGILNVPPQELTDEDHASPEVGNWHEVLKRFSKLPVDGYWDVFDPLKEDEPVFNSLADDLADIYRDLKAELYFFDKNEIANAVWEWRFNFIIHWGAHLVGAQRAIHAYVSEIEDRL